MGCSQVSVPWPHSAIGLSLLLGTLMPADRKQLLASARSAAVSAADWRYQAEGAK